MPKRKLSEKDAEDAVADSVDQNNALKAIFDDAAADKEPASENATKEVDLKNLFEQDRKKFQKRKKINRQSVVYVDKKGKVLRTEAQEKERESRTIFIDNLPNQIKKEELVTFIRKLLGVRDIAVRIRSQTFEHGKGRGLFKLHKLNVLKSKLSDEGSCSAYCVLPTPEIYEKALTVLNNVLFLDRHIRVEAAGGGPNPFESSNAVFLGNLLLEITEEDIRGFLTNHNVTDVLKIRLIRDPVTRKGKGFGFVSFQSEDSVRSVLKLQGQYLQGRELRVKQVRDRTSEKDDKIRKNRSMHAPVGYKDKLKIKKQATVRRHSRHADKSQPVADNQEGARDWEGQHAKKKLSKELSGLTKQWKSSSDSATASAASKAKKKIEKEKRDARKNH
eukprot:TRINITY_DN12813_c0_g1_i1.p1 TRINITY_DN12813_c0_g1~~TRINITY_DN12813_c0_g1_i1.p1  ORF type:complete len:389 (+),score=83.47 TRINITY_DN12813_c0_g1_i1:35-1201(+)